MDFFESETKPLGKTIINAIPTKKIGTATNGLMARIIMADSIPHNVPATATNTSMTLEFVTSSTPHVSHTAGLDGHAVNRFQTDIP